jgi:alkylation response protein AidB-like acyl-CoA dehydrogenase
VSSGASDTERTALRAAISGVLGSAGSARWHWARLVELGLVGLGVDEADGGSGGSFAELALAVETCATTPVAAPILSATVAARAVLSAPHSEQNLALLAALSSGTLRAVLVLPESTPSSSDFAAQRSETCCVVGGTAEYVMDAAGADLLLVVGTTPTGPALVAVEATQSGVVIEEVPSLDRTRPLARVALNGVTGRLVASADEWNWPLVQAEIATLISSDSVGGTRAVLDATVEYAKTRMQFGRAIGSFQAVKHRLADMSVALDSSTTAADHAVAMVCAGDPEARLYSSIAKVTTTENYLAAARNSIQTFGGIGFTWEHSAHLHLKRAQANCQLYGTGRDHLLAVAEQIGL